MFESPHSDHCEYPSGHSRFSGIASLTACLAPSAQGCGIFVNSDACFFMLCIHASQPLAQVCPLTRSRTRILLSGVRILPFLKHSQNARSAQPRFVFPCFSYSLRENSYQLFSLTPPLRPYSKVERLCFFFFHPRPTSYQSLRTLQIKKQSLESVAFSRLCC